MAADSGSAEGRRPGPDGARLRVLRAGLLLASLLLVVGVGELIARILVPDLPPRRPALSPEEQADLPVLRTLPDLMGRDVRGQHRGVLFRTNAHGLRGPDVPVQPLPGTRRIGIAGDSVTMGWGVPEEGAYPALLEERLEQASPGTSWEVLNAGMAGLDTRRAINRLMHYDRVYQLDLLVYGFTNNDIENEHFEKRLDGEVQKRMLERTRSAMRSPSRLWRLVWPRILSLGESMSTERGTRSEELLYNYFHNEAAWAVITGALDELAAHARESERCAVVFIHTQLVQLGGLHPYTPIYDRVAAAAGARGLFVVRSDDRFAGAYEPHLWVSYFDAHPNAEGHALLAESLAEGVRALPERCWRGADARGR